MMKPDVKRNQKEQGIVHRLIAWDRHKVSRIPQDPFPEERSGIEDGSSGEGQGGRQGVRLDSGARHFGRSDDEVIQEPFLSFPSPCWGSAQGFRIRLGFREVGEARLSFVRGRWG